MRTLLALLLAAPVLAGCGEQCLMSSSEHFNRALVKRLALEGIDSEVRPERGGVCFPKRKAEKAVAASQDLTQHFLSVAIYLADECREKAAVDWATRAGLDFSVQEPARFGGSRRGKIMYLHSHTAAEVEANKKRRTEVKLPACPREASK